MGDKINNDQSLETDIYLKYFKELKEIFNSSKSWEEVIKSEAFYLNNDQGAEAFIDLVEEVFSTEVKNAQKLKELTKLKNPIEIYLEDKISLETIIQIANLSKYCRTLMFTLQEGGDYKELLKIDPKKFNLPKDIWKGSFIKNQEEAILYAISIKWFINEPSGLVMTPSLKYIAEEIKAPYSVLMDAYNLFRY
jgi:hypothetical protein